jgi:hypothetical protein
MSRSHHVIKRHAQTHANPAANLIGWQLQHYQSVRYDKLCHAVSVVAVGKLDKVYQSLRVHLFLRIVLSIVQY